MVKGHWQIVSKSRTGRPRYGAVEAVKAEDAPEAVKSLALSAAALIGDGLYGVDLKDSDSGPIIIEINDNPDIWVGEEDAAEGDRLYEQIISCFVRRINETLSGVISE
jgi:glutathione synthase/RimK-type ligase-like ATP-grasp enzyme